MPPPLPAPPTASKVFLLWLLTRLVGGIVFLCLLWWAIDALVADEPASTGDREWGDALGPAVGMWMCWGLVVSFDFFCSLPLLLGVSASISRALRVPDGPTRRRRFFGAVACWQALPAVAAAIFLLSWQLPLLLPTVAFYLLVALALAWLLYHHWLVDTSVA